MGELGRRGVIEHDLENYIDPVSVLGANDTRVVIGVWMLALLGWKKKGV